MNTFSKVLLYLGVILVAYGYICREMGLYFFWESKSIGWTILFFAFITILVSRIKKKKNVQKKGIAEKIAVGFLSFILLIQIILVIAILYSDAFFAAKSYLLSNKEIQEELGSIKGFGIIPTGSIQKATDSTGTNGNAIINLTVKGSVKFKDVCVFVDLEADSSVWKVKAIE